MNGQTVVIGISSQAARDLKQFLSNVDFEEIELPGLNEVKKQLEVIYGTD